jgi:hypothetical protein
MLGWIDINLIVNGTMLPLILKFLGVTELREKACECLQEIVKKGMDPFAKIALLAKLKLVPLLSTISMVIRIFQEFSTPTLKNIFSNILKKMRILFFQDDDVDYLENVAILVNSIGDEILTSIEKTIPLVAETKESNGYIFNNGN